MMKEELVKKTRQELIAFAREVKLEGRSRMKKEELVHSISNLLKKREKEFVQPIRNVESAVIAVQEAPPEKSNETLEAKYDAHGNERGFLTSEELPVSYGDNRIVLMVRDPHWAYVYWEINSSKIEDARQRLQSAFDQSRLILRVYDITSLDFDGSNALSYFDIEIPNVLGNWYVHLGGPNRSFCIDIGYRMPDGGIFTISRSNRITLPRDTFSDLVDEEWALLEDHLYAWSSSGTGASAELVERLKRGISSAGIRGLGSHRTH